MQVRQFGAWLGLTMGLTIGCDTHVSPSARTDSVASRSSNQSDSITFCRDIAPLIFEQCAPCHRPGEAAPFSLLSYADVVSHGDQMVEVTQRRLMPPWLPEPGHPPLEGTRRLTDEQIAMLRTWVAAKMPEGNQADLPPKPEWTDGWQLGSPDLVITMPEPFTLPAEGRDVYRNFVIPIPANVPAWVNGLEFRPGNRRIVHHAFMLIDRSGDARRLDAQDSAPGFEGMGSVSGQSPGGHFISWQPGKMPKREPAGMAWYLTPGTDLVLQVHMQPTGKEETLQASVGFFFTPNAPVRTPFKIVLDSTDLEIPAGESNYKVEKSYKLPVDVELTAIIPHAHYLGKTMEAIAEYPSGQQDMLFRIPDWDFNWQGDYRFEPPIALPRGTRLIQRFYYDNSAANVRNPNHPPATVRFGPQSSDEMAELWLQLLPKDSDTMQVLQRDYGQVVLQNLIRTNQAKLKRNPADIGACIELGKVALTANDTARAKTYFERAMQLNPQSPDAWYYRGHANLRSGNVDTAQSDYQRAVALDGQYHMAYHDLGLIHLRAGEYPEAERLFKKSLELAPYHATSLSNLGMVHLQQGNLTLGIELLEQSLRVRPDNRGVQEALEKARSARDEMIP